MSWLLWLIIFFLVLGMLGSKNEGKKHRKSHKSNHKATKKEDDSALLETIIAGSLINNAMSDSTPVSSDTLEPIDSGMDDLDLN